MTAAAVLAQALGRDARDGWRDRPLWDFVAASGLQALVVAASKDPNAKITVLLVSRQSRMPLLAVKAPTTAAAEHAVDLEAAALAQLGTVSLGSLRDTIPGVVGYVEFEQRRAAVMTALPGRPMSTVYAARRHTRRPENVARDFGAAGTWLAELQRITAREHASLELDDGVVARLCERFADDPELDADVERLAAIHARLRVNRVPRTTVHGDFWLGNILFSGERISGVVDWEAASASGEPVRDLVRFANMYALYLDRCTRRGRPVRGHPGLRADRWGAGIEYAIRGTGWFPGLYRQFIADGLARLGADAESWRDVALAGIAEVAALTDHQEFGRLHLELFRRLAAQQGEA